MTEHSHLEPVGEHLLTSTDPGTAELIGGRCRGCGAWSFPALPGCQRCSGTDIASEPLGRSGTLWTWTQQLFMPPSPPFDDGRNNPAEFEPFFLGYVEIPGKVRVMSRLKVATAEALRIGMPLELTLVQEARSGGRTVVNWAFCPARS